MLFDELPVEIIAEFCTLLVPQDHSSYQSLASLALTNRTIYPVACRELYRKVKFEANRLDSSLHCAHTILTNDVVASFVGELVFSLKLPIYSSHALDLLRVDAQRVFTAKMVGRLLERVPNLKGLVLQPFLPASTLPPHDDVRGHASEIDDSRLLTEEVFTSHRTRFRFSLTAFSTSLFLDPFLLDFCSQHPKLATFSTLFPIRPSPAVLDLSVVSPEIAKLPINVETSLMPKLTLLCSFSHLALFTFRILKLLVPNRPLRAVFIAVPFWSHKVYREMVPLALTPLAEVPTLRYISFMGYIADFVHTMQVLASMREKGKSAIMALQFLVYNDAKEIVESELVALLTAISTFKSIRFIAFYEVSFDPERLFRLFAKVPNLNPGTMFVFTDTYGEVGHQGPGTMVWKNMGRDGKLEKEANMVDISADTIEEIRRLTYLPTNEDVYLEALGRLSVFYAL